MRKKMRFTNNKKGNKNKGEVLSSREKCKKSVFKEDKLYILLWWIDSEI